MRMGTVLIVAGKYCRLIDPHFGEGVSPLLAVLMVMDAVVEGRLFQWSTIHGQIQTRYQGGSARSRRFRLVSHT